MRPAHGGRIVLRASAGGETQLYRVELYTKGDEWRGTARISVERGEVSFDETEGTLSSAPAWLQQQTRALLRALWRSHSADGWPRRLTRWRPEPESAP